MDHMRTRGISRRQLVGGAAGIAVATSLGGRTVAAQATPEASPAVGGTRSFAHAMGVTEIPANPQRVVVLDGPILDAAIAVGVVPVGATTATEDEPWPTYLGDGLDGIANVGIIAEPNLERIVAAQPDLIIGSVVRNEAIYPQLAEIAPTVFSDTLARDWREGFLFFSDALNRADRAGAVIAAYEEKIAAIQDGLGDTLAETSVSVIRILGDQIRSYNINSFSGIVLGEIGFARPEIQQAPDDSWSPLSLEQLGEIDASALFVTLWTDDDATNLATLAQNPLWSTLSAVQEERVYLVPDEYWMTGIGYLAAAKLLDDVQAYLVDGQAAPELPTA